MGHFCVSVIQWYFPYFCHYCILRAAVMSFFPTCGFIQVAYIYFYCCLKSNIPDIRGNSLRWKNKTKAVKINEARGRQHFIFPKMKYSLWIMWSTEACMNYNTVLFSTKDHHRLSSEHQRSVGLDGDGEEGGWAIQISVLSVSPRGSSWFTPSPFCR